MIGLAFMSFWEIAAFVFSGCVAFILAVCIMLIAPVMVTRFKK